MEDQVMTIEKTPEEIEREMASTRESLSEKAAALEEQVFGTVQAAADTLSGTMEAVNSLVNNAPDAVSQTVQQAVSSVGETVKDAFDITQHIQARPWATVGGSFAVGCLLGWISARAPRTIDPGAPTEDVPAFSNLRAAVAPTPTPPPAPSQPGFFDEVASMIGDKLRELAKTGVESVSAAIQENLQDTVPLLLNEAASRLVDNGHGQPAPEPADAPAMPAGSYRSY